MSVFVRVLSIHQVILLKVDFVQDMDGNGEIGIEEVSGSLLFTTWALPQPPQFKPLWDYVKVGYHSGNFSVSFNPSLAAMARNVRVL
jgi:hypothetical protein